MRESSFVLPFQNHLHEARQRDVAADELGVARCPLCQAPLRIKVDCEGPRFVCQCEAAKRNAA